MKPNKLQLEADKKLKEFSAELKQTKWQVVKIKHQMIGLAVLPLVLVPLVVGYIIFKKPRSEKIPVVIESEPSSLPKEIIQKPLPFPWLSSVIKEICIIAAGKLASNLLQKR